MPWIQTLATRLCSMPSPVTEFDLSESAQWDTEFHQWCKQHPDPLAGVDLSGIPLALREMIESRQPPDWLPKPPPAYEVLVTEIDLGSTEQVNTAGGFAGGESIKLIHRLLEQCPVVLRFNLIRETAESFQHRLEECGVTAEVRVMEPAPFRCIRD